jgi:hypothetical protein
MSMFKSKQALTHRMIELTALLAVVTLALSTRWGPGVAGDATIYITSARSLVQGLGLGLPGPQGDFRLLPYFPPFFSLVLSVFGWLHINLTDAARWLNIGCFAGMVWMAGKFTYRFSQKSVFSILAAVILAVSPVLIPVYAWAMSEPLSAFLGFGGLILTVYAINYPEKNSYWVFAALLTGLSFLTRYSALAYIGAALLGILLLTRGSWGGRLARAFMFAVISAVPMTIWLVYDVLNTATVGSRRLLTLADMISRFASFWPPLKDSILFWIIPESWFYAPVYPSAINQLWIPAALVILVAWIAVVAVKLKKGSQDFDDRFTHLVILLVGFVVLYFGVILGVYLTTYPPITIANRMLSPLYTAVLWLVVLLGIITVKLWPQNKSIQISLTLFLVLTCVYYGWRSTRLVINYYNDGLGYTAPVWQQSQTIEQVRNLPAGTIIVSNEINAIQYLADRPAYPLKEIFNDHPLDTFSRYGDGSLNNDQSQQLFRDGRAVLVLFDTIDDQMSGLYGDRTSERISDLVKGLNQTYRGADGGVFYYPKP